MILVGRLPEQGQLIDLEESERERVDSLARAVAVGEMGDDRPFVAKVLRILF